MIALTTTRLPYGDADRIAAWYRTHSGMIAHPPTHHGAQTTYTRHTIKEPPKVPARQAHCSCGAILIVEDEDNDEAPVRL